MVDPVLDQVKEGLSCHKKEKESVLKQVVIFNKITVAFVHNISQMTSLNCLTSDN